MAQVVWIDARDCPGVVVSTTPLCLDLERAMVRLNIGISHLNAAADGVKQATHPISHAQRRQRLGCIFPRPVLPAVDQKLDCPVGIVTRLKHGEGAGRGEITRSGL